jgi:hypothetical protein
MKKLLCGALAAVSVFAFSVSPAFAVSAATAHTADDWDLTRAEIEYTAQGIEITQTEMGIPDSQAIAILEVPFENLDSFEIKFNITMNDYVASGRLSNDVWAAVNVMGVPAFFNWRNSATYGWAKDTPGLVTRFFSYDGDLRLITDVYQEGYKTAGDDPSSQTVDTWTCLNTSAGASIDRDVTMKLVWETLPDDASKSFYSMYINGNKVSTSDELAFVDRSVLFPENKLYLTVVMNTQDKATNEFSKVVIKEINGVSMATGNDSNSGTTDSNTNNDDKKSSGCGSVIEVSGMALIALGGCAILLRKRRD